MIGLSNTRVAKLIASFKPRADHECLIWRGTTVTYGAFDMSRGKWLACLRDMKIDTGSVIAIRADYSESAIALFFALLSHGCIASLLPRSAVREEQYFEDGHVEGVFRFDLDGDWSWEGFARRADHPLIDKLRANGEAGFAIFSSGSTGRPKAVLHSAERFLLKFARPGKSFRTLAFLLFDHIAGLDTMFYALANGACLVLPERRDPLSICRLIERHRVEVLPCSPAFLKLLCLSKDYDGLDLSSLKIITYGSEPMSQEVLDEVCGLFPHVRTIQKYGTSEFGAPRAHSRAQGSLWLRLKKDEVDMKVIDDILWVRTDTAMLGYLNAENPFVADGWYCTGDLVEQEGDWIRILGRESEIIMVGGEKVYPQEVESVIQELDWVGEVVVSGEANAFLGNIVAARIAPLRPVAPDEARRAVRKHCHGRLANYKVPAKVEVVEGRLTSERQKKIRN